MDIFTIAALVQAGIGLYKTLDSSNRPESRIPASVNRALGEASLLMRDPFAPGYDTFSSQAQLAAANAIENSRQQGTLNENLGAILGQQLKANQDLSILSEQDQRRDIDTYMQQLGIFGEWENTIFQQNELGQYEDQYNEGREMLGAGLTNLYLTQDNERTKAYVDDILTGTEGTLSSQYGSVSKNRNPYYNIYPD